ncbi:TIGR00730 family Rossman fold protein [Actinomadura roseirufa]|uniref:LOG family protein n=1 Tax=Actinomadura roseirufa TaxID=2094049 RepID=UPI00104124D6|nr:TIGR00730 family Rossman fold protein [Actinomadura roseirufa]
MAAIGVFCGASRTLDGAWLELARDFGTELAKRGHVLVTGGGRVGLMGTVAQGARAAGGHTVGVIPRGLVDLEVADHDSDELRITRGMAERKTAIIDRSDAFVILPGGLGTLDELFEIWTTGSLGMHGKPIVIVDVDGFYTGLIEWIRGLTGPGFVRPEAAGIVTVVGSGREALDVLER